jgi:hypothetical protein
MKHKHVVPNYGTLRVFSLTAVPNVSGPPETQAFPFLPKEESAIRHRMVNVVLEEFYEWGRQFGPSPVQALKKLLNYHEGAEKREAMVFSKAFQAVLNGASDREERCKVDKNNPAHQETHEQDFSASGILFGIFLKTRIDKSRDGV